MNEVEAEPNLIPVMNLFVAMIPFLLLAVAFFQVGVIPTTLPTHTENTSDVEASGKAVTVSLVINDEGFSLTIMNQSIPEAQLNALAQKIPQKSGQYNYEELQATLRSIKQRYTKSDTIIMLPTGKVPYGDLVSAMDAARYEVTKEGGQTRRTPLFPMVVLSTVR